MKKRTIEQMLIIFSLGIVSTLFLKNTLKMLSSGRRLDELREEVSLLEEEKRALEDKIAFKQTDEFVEEQARNNLNLIKPKEEVFIIPEFREDSALSDSAVEKISQDLPDVMGAETEKGLKGSNIYLWYRLFFH